LRIPVLAYSLVIIVMTASAHNLANLLATPHYWYLSIGTIVFVLSDGLIAINKFTTLLPPASFWIMLTYIVAQYLRDFAPTADKFPNVGLTPFALAMPKECKSDDAVESYRKYYQTLDKQRIASWKKRGKPTWYKFTDADDDVEFTIYVTVKVKKSKKIKIQKI
jgi:hypothetical protein